MDSNDFVGTWTLVGLSLTDREGTVSDRHGDGSMGRIIYAADGNMGIMTRRGAPRAVINTACRAT